jgi:hypothetical protein
MFVMHLFAKITLFLKKNYSVVKCCEVFVTVSTVNVLQGRQYKKSLVQGRQDKKI